MKRRVLLLVLSLILVLGLVAPVAVQAEEKVQIRHALWNKDQEPYLIEAAKIFNETYPNIEIVTEVTPWDQYWTKLEAAATGGSIADVFWMNGPNIALYADGGILMPITDRLADSEIDLAKYPEGLVNLYTIDEQNYAIPKDFDTIGLYFNKEIFDEAGVEYPTDDWTWDDLVEKARAIKEANLDGVQAISVMNSNQEGYYSQIFANGGFVISEDKTKSGYDDPKTVEAIEAMRSMMEEGLSPTLAEQEDANVNERFMSNKLAMVFGGSWRIAQFAMNDDVKDIFDAVELPSFNGEKATVIHGLGNCISAFSDNQDEAWLWVEFLAGKEANDLQATMGAAIPAFSDSTQLWAESFPQYNLQAFITAAEEYSVAYPASKNTAAWNQYETDVLKKVFNLEVTSEEGCTELAQQMNDALASE